MKKIKTSVLLALIASLVSAGSARASGKNDCRDLNGTARIHCETGSDPHTGTPPGDPAEKTPEEKAQELKNQIDKLQQDLDDLRESLNKSERNESMEDAVTRATDLSQGQKDILTQIEKLVGQRNELWRQEREMKKTERSGKLPADHDCTSKRGHR